MIQQNEDGAPIWQIRDEDDRVYGLVQKIEDQVYLNVLPGLVSEEIAEDVREAIQTSIDHVDEPDESENESE